MPAQDEDPGFLASHQSRESISWLPWIIAAVVIILGLGILIVVGGRTNPETTASGTGMAPADPYAAKLSISGLQMSEGHQLFARSPTLMARSLIAGTER